MRVVVVGASGNVGTAVLRRLAREDRVDAVTGVARRVPGGAPGEPYDGGEWHAVDVGADGAVGALTDVFAGAGAVIHLAWQIQPSHDRAAIRATNVTGTAHVAQAAVRASVPALVVASSVGAYAPGPKDERGGEDWPVAGGPRASYRRSTPTTWPRRTPARCCRTCPARSTSRPTRSWTVPGSRGGTGAGRSRYP